MKILPELAPFATQLNNIFYYDSAIHITPKNSNIILVLIHGLGDEADSWRHIFVPLAQKQRVLALDLPGFGRSLTKKASSIKRHCAAVERLLDSQHKVILIGNSMGGTIAQLVALKHPQTVAGIIILDGGLPTQIKPNFGILLTLIPGINEYKYKKWKKNAQNSYNSLRSYYAQLDNLPSQDKEFLRIRVKARVLSDAQRKGYSTTFRSYLRTILFCTKIIIKELKQSSIPICLIWGEKDKILPPESRKTLLSIRKDIIDVIIQDAGHLPHQEQAQKVIVTIENFIRSIQKTL